jgi:hypothetical protein
VFTRSLLHHQALIVPPFDRFFLKLLAKFPHDLADSILDIHRIAYYDQSNENKAPLHGGKELQWQSYM